MVQFGQGNREGSSNGGRHSLAGSAGLLSRRDLLRAAGTVSGAALLGILGPRLVGVSEGQTSPRLLKLAWNPGAACLTPVAVAQHRGFFTKHNLNVELVNFAGSTEQLLEAIATGKADAGVGMTLRWLKPLEQGFDVRLTAGLHGGCMRLLTLKTPGIADLKGLRGKTIAVSDMASPAKNFFAIVLAKQGLDPEKDVQWRQYPADLLGLALEKGEAQAVAHWDPITFLLLKDEKVRELATNLSGEYQQRVCCVLGVRGSLIRQDRPAAAALTRALIEAVDRTNAKPDQGAQVMAQYAKASVADLTTMLRSYTLNHHPVAADLKREIALYAEELKLVAVIRPSTDPAKFAESVYANVLS